MFKILSIDGGGLRGVIPVQILKHIENVTGRATVDMFDMFAGTSTGGLISSALTVRSDNNKQARYSLDDVERIYLERGSEIFPVRNRLHKWYREKAWSYLSRPQFSPKGLQNVLDDVLRNNDGTPYRMSDCVKPIFVPTYDLSTNSPLFFKSRHAFHNAAQNARLIDVCRATSAGPTYLPAYSFDYPHTHGRMSTERVTAIDGGVFMNNPALGALVEIIKYREDRFFNRSDLVDRDIFVLSIGTGHYSNNAVPANC